MHVSVEVRGHHTSKHRNTTLETTEKPKEMTQRLDQSLPWGQNYHSLHRLRVVQYILGVCLSMSQGANSNKPYNILMLIQTVRVSLYTFIKLDIAKTDPAINYCHQVYYHKSGSGLV